MNREATMNLVKRLLGEVQEFMDGEDCDHSVGICYCSTKRTIDAAMVWIASESEDAVECPDCEGTGYVDLGQEPDGEPFTDCCERCGGVGKVMP